MNTRRYASFSFSIAFSSSIFSPASATVIEKAGPEGISLVSLSASPGGTFRVRATSFTAARAFIVPKVMIWPTESRP